MSWAQPSTMQALQSQQTAPQSEGPSEAEITALKRLSSFVIADDDDAGNVIDVINSLTQTYLQYKTRTLSNPVRELLIKSLKNGNEGLECILKHYGVENMKPLEKFSDINNPTTRCASNVLRQFSAKWKEDTNIPPPNTKVDSSLDRPRPENVLASTRNERDYPLAQSSRNWNDSPLRRGGSNLGDGMRGTDSLRVQSDIPSDTYYRNNMPLQSNKEPASIVDLFKSYRTRK